MKYHRHINGNGVSNGIMAAMAIIGGSNNGGEAWRRQHQHQNGESVSIMK
jgi:hypothetical protein